MFELNNFDSIRIGIASPEKIREWSHGEVTRPETINYRTQKPEPDGLFCEKIFGPTKDWRCRCGKYKLIRYKGVICDKCGVEVTRSAVRRERMGHIELATPVSHIWFFKGVPSKIGTMLELSPKVLQQILYYVNYIVIDPKNTPLQYKQVLSDKEYADACDMYGEENFRVGMGAAAIKELLSNIDLQAEDEKLKSQLLKCKGLSRVKISKRLEMVEAFIKSGNKPQWMILDVIPVIPPDLRPLVQLDGGRFATSDLNDLYRRVINRNNRLKKLIELGAPEVIIRNEKRMLQEAVDALFANGKNGKAVQGPKSRDLKSLTAMLSGKQGRFRQNLLGKRVDFSGRSVIVVGPELKMHQCGVPKEMALELFKPFIMCELMKMNATNNMRTAKKMIEREKPVVWDVLDKVIKDHPVLLNRAPTLHRLGIQAFEPVLVEGNAIKIHPLVCKGFHADFDGDQMPIHIPLSLEARSEARNILLSTNNILKLSDGKPVVTPTLDMVIGAYCMTIIKPGSKGEGSVYKDEDEAVMAYMTNNLSVQAEIKVRRTATFDGEEIEGLITTTVGRILFNRVIPQNVGLVDRTKKENALCYEINKAVTQKDFAKLVELAYNNLGGTVCVNMLDGLKEFGFKYSTLQTLTMSIYDMVEPKTKQQILDETDAKVAITEKQYRRGFITRDEKATKNIATWTEATNKVKDEIMGILDQFNPIRMMADSGARGSGSQINQMCGMRGIVANTSGNKVDVPIRSNYRDGFSPIEYFMSTRGGRKVLADTALKTSESGYFTRRLVDVAHEIVITEEDCFADNHESIKGITVQEVVQDNMVIETLEERISGRYTASPVIDPKTNETIVDTNQMITAKLAKKIVEAGIKEVSIRSVLTCKCKNGVCAKCYGKNMANNNEVPIGEAVGIIAAQSIGEPGTQLTMKNFSASVVGGGDMTRGLPRVIELFEARTPKGMAYISEISGTVSLKQVQKQFEVTVTSSSSHVSYLLPYGLRLLVKDGDKVEPGDPLTEGSIDPKDLLRIRGVKGVEEYLLSQVLSVYRAQDIHINEKHIEIVVRQMLRMVRVETSGSTNLVPGDLVDIYKCEEQNNKVLAEGGEPAMVKREILGITKASLSTESFLSAASFQETSSVLTDAAVKGKVDHLVGIKENVIIGKLIPAGTGLARYRNIIPKIVGEQNPDDVTISNIALSNGTDGAPSITPAESKTESQTDSASLNHTENTDDPKQTDMTLPNDSLDLSLDDDDKK
jgi:DNA-directed RNA polymerase subunit beta'